MSVRVQVPCPGCGLDRTPRFLGLAEDGHFLGAPPRELELHLHRFGGRGSISIEKVSMPAAYAVGLRALLLARVAQIDAELAAAGVEL